MVVNIISTVISYKYCGLQNTTKWPFLPKPSFLMSFLDHRQNGHVDMILRTFWLKTTVLWSFLGLIYIPNMPIYQVFHITILVSKRPIFTIFTIFDRFLVIFGCKCYKLTPNILNIGHIKNHQKHHKMVIFH